jgi:hypothetical protein
MYGIVRKNMERGRAEGLYREDFDMDVVAKLHVATAFLLFDEKLFPEQEYSKAAVLKEYIVHYLYGIMSEKGYAILREKLS